MTLILVLMGLYLTMNIIDIALVFGPYLSETVSEDPKLRNKPDIRLRLCNHQQANYLKIDLFVRKHLVN